MKSMLIKALLAIVIVILIFYYYWPVKIATKIENPPKNTMICETVKTTDFKWSVKKSFDGYQGLAFLDGNISQLEKLAYPAEWGHNKFLITVEAKGERDYYGESYPVYEVISWDIIYPVTREHPFEFLRPKYGLTLSDFD